MEQKIAVTEKSHRLPKEFYRGQVTVFYTLCIKDKQRPFTSNKTVSVFVGILKEALEKHKCRDFAYVFMPDHVHLIIEGTEEDSDLWKMMKWYKQKTGYWFSRNLPEFGWQKDYYDHIHQKKADFISNMAYVLNNPVRQKLCNDWEEYDFLGSTSYSLEDLV